MKKLLIIPLVLVFPFLSIAQSIITIHPIELLQKELSLKFEYFTPNQKYGIGVLYSHYSKSKDPQYTGNKVCPFIRLYQTWRDNKPTNHYYAQFKLIGGYFNSHVEFIGPDNAGGPNTINPEVSYLTVGIGVACGMQIISKSSFCIDFSLGTQYNPQLVDKTIIKNNTTYHYGTNGFLAKFPNVNLPWIFSGPGSMIELRLGIGFKN